MKRFIPLILLFAMPLHSSPVAQFIQMAGSVELSKTKYEVVLDAHFMTERAHTIQYKGKATLISQEKFLERPITLTFTKKRTRMVASILMNGNAQNEGLYLELTTNSVSNTQNVGDLLSTEAVLMWMIRSPYMGLSETSFIYRDRGQAHLEVLGLR